MYNATRTTVLLAAAAALLAAGQDEGREQERQAAADRQRAVADRQMAMADREKQKIERSYSAGMRALDSRSWAEAVEAFQAVAAAKGARADGALYWQAYALMKQAQVAEAQSALEALQSGYPQSRWLDDAEALAMSIRDSAGQPPDPELEQDEVLKLYAINALAGSNPERAVPLLKKILESPNDPKLKERALFVLAMTGSKEAIPIVVSMAQGGGNPDLQLKAIEYLGMIGDDRHNDTLAKIFDSSGAAVQRRVVRAYMMSGNRAGLLAAAKGNAAPEVRRDAIRQLGAMDADDALWDLYQGESNLGLRTEVVRALAIGGSERLIELAGSETNPELRGEAIKHLGLRRDQKTTDALLALYASDLPPAQKRSVIEGLFMQQNAKALVALARQEQNPELKKALVKHLSMIQAPEVTEFMEELLGAP